MTEKQKIIYETINGFIEENGYSPSVRELCELVGLRSTATMFVHLKKMKEKGYLTYKEGQSRTIVLYKLKEDHENNNNSL